VTNTSSDIEFLNGMFLVNKYDCAITITGSEPCQMLTHNNIFTPQMASVLSGVNQIHNKSVVVIGCGALGSKISLSLARMGLNKQTIIDSDLLMPHNLARHALYEDCSKDYVFKATAQQKVINQIFNAPGAKSIPKDLQEIDLSTLSQNNYIIDCSASGIVLDYLSSYKFEITRVIRCELALNGQLGFVFICNKEQNPSLSDMRLQLIYAAVTNSKISQWLRESAQNKSDFAHQEFSIGFGCSSDTMILDDATINVHAGTSAAIIKNLSETDEAKIIVNIFNCENFSENATFEIPCEKFEIHTVGDWIVKITDKKEAELKSMAKARAETGGILIGNIDKRKKVIIITDYYIPEDNQESVGGLVRGSKGIKEHIDNLVKNTAGVISYVGEWHTHPRNSTDRSLTDIHTFTYLVSVLGKIELPALMGIFNESSASFFVEV
jgi:integrative and conjugative element protein (TIGR02256 family)